MKRIKFFSYIIGIVSISCTCVSCSLFEDEGYKDDPNRGLVMYYTFDNESAEDSSPKKCDGILINNPNFISDTPSGIGKALFINGIKEQSVNIPYNPTADSTCYSMCFWIKDFSTGNIIASFDSYNGRSACDLTALVESRNFQFKTRSQDYKGDGISILNGYDYTSIQQGAWHHIAFVVSQNETENALSLYVDGVLSDKQNWRYSESTAIKFQLGNNSEGIVNFKMDNFRLYNRSLTKNEVKMIYNSEKKIDQY